MPTITPRVQVWSLGTPTANMTLEGHEKGVNCVDYYSGAQGGMAGPGGWRNAAGCQHMCSGGRCRPCPQAAPAPACLPACQLPPPLPALPPAGGDRPYLVSGADDRLVKVWDYQTKACIQTLDGHSHNISTVCFHPELPLIATGSEDGTVKLWHSTTYRQGRHQRATDSERIAPGSRQ